MLIWRKFLFWLFTGVLTVFWNAHCIVLSFRVLEMSVNLPDNVLAENDQYLFFTVYRSHTLSLRKQIRSHNSDLKFITVVTLWRTVANLFLTMWILNISLFFYLRQKLASVQTCMMLFIQWNTKREFLKNSFHTPIFLNDQKLHRIIPHYL